MSKDTRLVEAQATLNVFPGIVSIGRIFIVHKCNVEVYAQYPGLEQLIISLDSSLNPDSYYSLDGCNVEHIENACNALGVIFGSAN
tara:strand:- start:394 stop:651 length:258 start_codon:yes stop_codon:yes gene_type:complete